MVELSLPVLGGAILLAAMLGPLGSFVVWRKMAYFGDTVAHASLLGVALSLTTALPMQAAIFLVAISVALILAHYTRRQQFEADTILGILAHSGLAFGILLISLAGAPGIELEEYLFGNVFTLEMQDFIHIGLLAVAVFAILARYWRALLIATIDPAVATVEGVSPAKMQLLITLLLAAVVAFTVKLTGALLITALLIIPPASVRYLAHSPRQMAVLASLFGISATTVGLITALRLETPAGPTIVASAAALFVLGSLLHRRA